MIIFFYSELDSKVHEKESTKPTLAETMSEVTDVCFTGYVMDVYCIQRGTLLDTGQVSLENPDKHSVHCLVDPSQCVNNGYELLEDLDDDGADDRSSYGRAYRLDSEGEKLALALARKEGSTTKGYGCTTCTGGGTLEKGFRATVFGTHDGSGSPVKLSVTDVQPSSVVCPHGNVSPPFVVYSGGGSLVPYYNAHGALMLIGWGLMLPAGVVVAKLGKHRSPDGWWFKRHRAVQMCGLLLALVGFVIALTQFSVLQGPGWSPPRIHGILGCVVMGLGLLQPLNAFLRPPHKQEQKPPERGAGNGGSDNDGGTGMISSGSSACSIRTMWEWLHRGVGWCAVLLAVPTLALGCAIHPSKTAFASWFCVMLCLVLGLAVWLYFDRQKKKSKGSLVGARVETEVQQAGRSGQKRRLVSPSGDGGLEVTNSSVLKSDVDRENETL